MPVSAQHMIVSRPRANVIVTVAPVDVVIAFACVDVVSAKGTKQIVISCRPDDRRGANDGKMGGLHDCDCTVADFVRDSHIAKVSSVMGKQPPAVGLRKRARGNLHIAYGE